jgi:hypothetical protein
MHSDQKLFNVAAMIYFGDQFDKPIPSIDSSYVGQAKVVLRDTNRAKLADVLMEPIVKSIESEKYGFIACELDLVIANYREMLEQKRLAKEQEDELRRQKAMEALSKVAEAQSAIRIGVTVPVDLDGDGLLDAFTSFNF